jgi:hypothetical protein
MEASSNFYVLAFRPKRKRILYPLARKLGGPRAGGDDVVRGEILVFPRNLDVH